MKNFYNFFKKLYNNFFYVLLFLFILFGLLLLNRSLYADPIPRSVIESDGFFDDSDYRYRQNNSYRNSLLPLTSDLERQQRMNRKFDSFVESQRKRDIYLMLGINEYHSDLDSNIAKGFSLGIRVNYEEILEQFLNIEAKHFYPYMTVGSKSISLSPFSYAIVDTEALKLYIDPLIPMVNIEEGEVSMASGLSAGYYHDRYSAWGIEAMIKYIWLNPYQEYDYEYAETMMGRDYEDVERIKTSDKYRFFWGVHLVYRF